MTRFRLIGSLFAGTLIYVLLSVNFGPEGRWPMEQLYKQREVLYDNVQNIQYLYDDLSIQLTALTVDADEIASYARNLGYVKEGEYLIKLIGYRGQGDYTLDVGTPIQPLPPLFIPDWTCKLAGVISFALIYCLSIILFGNGKKYEYQNQKA